MDFKVKKQMTMTDISDLDWASVLDYKILLLQKTWSSGTSLSCIFMYGKGKGYG